MMSRDLYPPPHTDPSRGWKFHEDPTLRKIREHYYSAQASWWRGFMWGAAVGAIGTWILGTVTFGLWVWWRYL